MPTESEELVEFSHHGNTQIRQIAAENLVGFSTAQPSLFKRNQLEPIKDSKLIVRDYTPIAKNASDMLINSSAEDQEVLKNSAEDDAFLEVLLSRITDQKEPNANLFAMLLANLAKHDTSTRLLTLSRSVPKPLSTSPIAIDQSLDLFVKGAEGSYNKDADYDYLCYLFADLSKHAEGRKHFLAPRKEDQDIVPSSKSIVFTEHKNEIRRRGVASTIKNVTFDIDAHTRLSSDDPVDDGVNSLPYISSPLMGPEEYSDEDTEGMLEDSQSLPPDKEREKHADIIKTHSETSLLLTTTREGRDRFRSVKVYPIIRESHLQHEDEEVREGCDRVVQIIARDEEGEGEEPPEPPKIQEVEEVEEDEEDQIVEVL